MNLDDLRSVQADERRADSLQALPDDFYRDVAAYIADLRAERDEAAEAADDPFGSEDVRLLTDEIETAEEVAEAVYERRIGKVVKRASLAAAGMPADQDGLTAEERELFRDLVAKIEEHRAEVLASFDGEDRLDLDLDGDRSVDGQPPEETASSPDGDGRPSGAEAAAVLEASETDDLDAGTVMGEDAGPDEAATASDGAGTSSGGGMAVSATAGGAAETGESDAQGERTTIRVTTDVGEILGVDDRTYELSAEDVVTLPSANAEPLVERDAAEKLD